MKITTITLGISSCLLGYNVRYDGYNSLNEYILKTISPFRHESICPELECGLTVPRECMRLVGSCNSPKLVALNTNIDYTSKISKWIQNKLNYLDNKCFCGLIVKSKSPSCGLYSSKLYDCRGRTFKKTSGLFTKAFIDRFPYIPVEEDSRLTTKDAMREFISKVFEYSQEQ